MYSHGQELFYKFVSDFTNKLVKQLLSMTVESTKLISRKIRVIEKSWNFHAVVGTTDFGKNILGTWAYGVKCFIQSQSKPNHLPIILIISVSSVSGSCGTKKVNPCMTSMKEATTWKYQGWAVFSSSFSEFAFELLKKVENYYRVFRYLFN